MKQLILCMLVAAAAGAPTSQPSRPLVSSASKSVKPQTGPPQLAVKTGPQQTKPNGPVQVLRYDNDNNGTGNYQYGLEQSDGTKVNAIGELKNEGRENQSVAVRGSYEWIASDGAKYTVTYIADENGYRPHIEKDGTSLDRHSAIELALVLSG